MLFHQKSILGWPQTYLMFLNVLTLFALITEAGKLFHIFTILTDCKGVISYIIVAPPVGHETAGYFSVLFYTVQYGCEQVQNNIGASMIFSSKSSFQRKRKECGICVSKMPFKMPACM